MVDRKTFLTKLTASIVGEVWYITTKESEVASVTRANTTTVTGDCDLIQEGFSAEEQLGLGSDR